MDVSTTVMSERLSFQGRQQASLLRSSDSLAVANRFSSKGKHLPRLFGQLWKSERCYPIFWKTHVPIINHRWSWFFSRLDISQRDVEHLKSIHIYTMQDLLGRFLIHDVSEQFQTFLIQTFQLSEPTASMITQLFERWTKYNLDLSRERQTIESIW